VDRPAWSYLLWNHAAGATVGNKSLNINVPVKSQLFSFNESDPFTTLQCMQLKISITGSEAPSDKPCGIFSRSYYWSGEPPGGGAMKGKSDTLVEIYVPGYGSGKTFLWSGVWGESWRSSIIRWRAPHPRWSLELPFRYECVRLLGGVGEDDGVLFRRRERHCLFCERWLRCWRKKRVLKIGRTNRSEQNLPRWIRIYHSCHWHRGKCFWQSFSLNEFVGSLFFFLRALNVFQSVQR